MLKRIGLEFLFHLSIRTKIIGLVVFLLLIAGLIGAVGTTRMLWVGQQLDVLVEGSLPLEQRMASLRAAQLRQSVQVERASRLPYMLINDKTERLEKTQQAFERHGETARQAISESGTLLSEMAEAAANDGARQRLSRLRQALNKVGDHHQAYHRRALAALQAVRESGNPQDIKGALPEIRGAAADMEKAIAGLEKRVNRINGRVAARASAYESGGLAWVMGVSVLGLGGGLLFGLALSQTLARPLRAVSRQIVEIADSGNLTRRLKANYNDEIGQLGRSLNSLLEELQQFMGEVVTKSYDLGEAQEELSATAGEIGSNAEQASRRVDEVSASAQEVNAVVQEVARNISGVSESANQSTAATNNGKQAVDRASQRIYGLQEASGRVGEIIATIEDIAKKTDLLALNAAIEAANAGEQGKGFAVVADEVRKLAEQTSQATSQVNDIVGELQQHSESSVTAMGEVQERMDTVLSYIEHTDQSANQIASSAEELAATMSQTSGNMGEINQGVDRVAQSTDDIQREVGRLGELANDLQAAMSRFRAV